jgi:hypothetical protein
LINDQAKEMDGKGNKLGMGRSLRLVRKREKKKGSWFVAENGVFKQ